MHSSKNSSGKHPTGAAASALFQAGQTLSSIATPSSSSGANAPPNVGPSQSHSQSSPQAQHDFQSLPSISGAASPYSASASALPPPAHVHASSLQPVDSPSSTPSQASYALSASVSPMKASQVMQPPPNPPGADSTPVTMSQSQHFAPQGGPGSYSGGRIEGTSEASPPGGGVSGWKHDQEPHMSGASSGGNGHQHLDYGPATISGPRINLQDNHQYHQKYQQQGQVPTSNPLVQQQQQQQHQSQQQRQRFGAVPSILQPAHGSMCASRAPNFSANTATQLPTLQSMGSPQPQHQSPQQSHGEYSTSLKPSLSLSSHSHAYTRSSPAAQYESSSNYMAYTPTTPGGGPSSSQYMSPPSDQKYTAPGSQRNISNTPLGLADIRPRTDSSLSDGVPGTIAYELANAQPNTSNYLAPWALYAFDWCRWAPQGNGAGKVALGSYLEDGHNFIQILDTAISPTPTDAYQPGTSKYTLEFNRIAEATHSYPVTRLLWEPPSAQKQSTDLLATSGDHLRLWSLPSDTPISTPTNSITGRQREVPVTKLTPLALLSNSKTPDHTAPLTSLDWNTLSPSLIITSSIDTTCTIWDIPSLTAKTQLIAHDKEVYDVRFCANSVDVFVSCGQDGSVRMFDLRSLEHSTIIYEPTGKDDRDSNSGRISPTLAQQTMSNPPPLLRLATSPHDAHLLATFAQDSQIVRILDVRQPGQALLELRGHGGSVNCVDWSPHRRGTLATGGDDCQVLIWDIMSTNGPFNLGGANGASNPDAYRSPVAGWQCDFEVGNIGWVPRLPGEYGEWLGVSAGRGVWGIRI